MATQQPKQIPTEALGLNVAASSVEEITQSLIKVQQAMANVPDFGPISEEIDTRLKRINGLLDEVSLKVMEFNKTLGLNSTFKITIEGAKHYPEMIRKLEQVAKGEPTFDLTDIALLLAKRG